MTLRILCPFTTEPPPLPAAVEKVRMITDHDYAELLRRVWPWGDDLLIIEHDMYVPAETMLQLATMRVPAVVPYLLRPASTGHPRPVWSSWSYNAEYSKLVPDVPGTPYSRVVGLGCTFIPADHMSRRHQLPDVEHETALHGLPHWSRVDRWINDHVARWDQHERCWHNLWDERVVHTPVEDLHRVAGRHAR